MARNKSKKKSANKKPGAERRAAQESAGLKKAAPESSAPTSGKAGAGAAKPSEPAGGIKEPPAPRKASGLVRLSTCAAGMFLTFILGLYLGSFMPGIMSGMEREREAAEAAKPAPPAAESRQKPAAEKESPKPEAPLEAAAPAQPVSELARHVAHLEREALSHPDDAGIWTELGNGYFDSREPQKAIAAYRHSLGIAPNNPDVWTDLGIMYREIKDFGQALECFRKASAQNPAHINALFNEGVVLSADLNRKDEAASVWKRILEINPEAATPNGHKIADLVRGLQ